MTWEAWVRAVVCAVVAASGVPAWAEDIVAVLERSQSARLASISSTGTESERASIVRRSFDGLVQRLESDGRPEIRVVTGPVIVECLLGRVVVANESLADLREPMRLFLLAHEIGHVTLGHWHQITQLYSRYNQDEVVQTSTQLAADEFLIEASRLSQAHELEADAFAYQTLRALGYGFADVVGALTAFGMQRDTATHPGTGKRIAHLRSLG